VQLVSWTSPKIFACPSTPMVKLHEELCFVKKIEGLARRLPWRMVENFKQEAIAHLQAQRIVTTSPPSYSSTSRRYVGGFLDKEDPRSNVS